MFNELDMSIANSIIEKYGDIFSVCEISICDRAGIIIASNNTCQIGKQLTEEELMPDPQKISLGRSVLPIHYNNHILGKIIINGEGDSVEENGRAFQALAELTIDSYQKEHQFNRDERRKEALLEKLLSAEYNETELCFTESLESIGVMPSEHYAVILMSIDSQQYYNSVYLFSRVLPIITSYIDDNKDILHVKDFDFIWVTSLAEHEKRQRIKAIRDAVMSGQGVSLVVGIGRTYLNHKKIYQSYLDAMKAYDYAKIQQETIDYYDYIYEISINTIPDDLKIDCIKSCFCNCTYKEIKEILDLLSMYIEYEGSINLIAEHSYIHKNTVQYRINRIKEKTGLDLRKLNDFNKLQTISMYFDLLSKKTNIYTLSKLLDAKNNE